MKSELEMLFYNNVIECGAAREMMKWKTGKIGRSLTLGGFGGQVVSALACNL
jgi:hypothetical protein